MQVKSNADSAILLTFIKLPFVIKIIVSSISEWSFYTGFIKHIFLSVVDILHGKILFIRDDSAT